MVDDTLITPQIEEEEELTFETGLVGVPTTMPEGGGLAALDRFEEEDQQSLKQTFSDQVRQSSANDLRQYLADAPDAIGEFLTSGRADLEPYREELTKDIPLKYQDDIMSSATLSGARARRVRMEEDVREQRRLAAQTGLSQTAVRFAAGLIDLDLPLMFATGGTLAAAKTARSVAKTTKALTGSTAMARVAGDAAVGLTGGAIAGTITGVASSAVRDDYDAQMLMQNIIFAAATGGVLSPALGTVLKDKQTWSQAAELEMRDQMQRMHDDFMDQVAKPDSNLNNASKPIDDERLRGPVLVMDDAGSMGAASVGTAPKMIDVDDEIAKLNANKTQAGQSNPQPVDPRVQELADLGSSERVIRMSLQNEERLADSRFDANVAEDLENRWVRMLTGNAEYKVTLPLSKLTPAANRFNSKLANWGVPVSIPNTDRTVDLGQIAGTVFTLAHRDFTRLARSPSHSARFVASEILESASGLGRNGSTAALNKDIFFSSSMVHVMEPMLVTRGQFFDKRQMNPALASSHEAFAREFRLAADDYARTGKMNPEFEALLKGNDAMNKELLGHMRGMSDETSVRGAREIHEDVGYFKYAWSSDRVMKAIRETSEDAVQQAFSRGYQKRNGWSKEVADQIAAAIVRRYRNRALGVDATDSRMLTLDNRTAIESLLADAGVDPDQIKRLVAVMDASTQEGAKKSFLKTRLEVDLRENIGGSNTALVDLMEPDLERSIQAYGHEAAGAAALASKGIRDTADIRTLREAIIAENTVKNSEDQLSTEFIDAVLSQFSGRAHKGLNPITGEQTNGVAGLTSMFTSATRASLLQRLGLTSLMDTANIFVANGLKNTMEPAMGRLGFDRVGKLSKKELSVIHDSLESIGLIVGQDHIIFRSHLAIDEMDAGASSLFSAGLGAVRGVEKATYYISGHNHVLAQQQKVAAAATYINIIRSIGGNGGTLDARRLRDIGLTESTIGEIFGEIQAGRLSVEAGKVTKDFGSLSKGASDELTSGLYRAVSQQAQRGLIGESSVWMNSDIGKLLTTLKTFSMIASQKQTARNLMIGGAPHFLAASAWQLGFAYSVLSLSQAIQGQEMSATDRARLALAYTPTLGTVPMVTDPLTTMLGFDDLNFSPYGRYASYIDTPVFEQTQKLIKAPGSMVDMFSGEGSYDDMKNARAMFFMNWYGMKQFWENL